jgi:uncharacterized membrane protein (DUF485 family)
VKVVRPTDPWASSRIGGYPLSAIRRRGPTDPFSQNRGAKPDGLVNDKEKTSEETQVMSYQSSHDLSVIRILKNPKYAELVRQRSRLAWTLSGLMMLIYFAFIAVIAFAPQILATPLFAGSAITIGFPIGVAVILSAIVLTGIYVHRANTEFDALTKDLIEGVK